MCLLFLLQYFHIVITVQISRSTLITPMAISSELVLLYQAKFVLKHRGLVFPTRSQTNSPAAKSAHPFLHCSPSALSVVPILTPTPPSDNVTPDQPSENEEANVEDGSGST